jgi:rod shape-determining protein MreC
MINDQSSGVGVFLEKSRLQGVLRGTPNGELVLERVMNDEQVTPGEAILSSGGDQIFPKGLPVGTVSKVGPGREMFLSVKVTPAADLSRLEEVLVVTEKQEREAVAESGTRVRAADILARRLPSVPDKPAAGAGAPQDVPAKSQPNSANAAGQPSSGEVVKKVVPKPASGAAGTKSATGSAGLTGTTTGAASGTTSEGPSSVNSPAKPATAQPKPPAPQPAPQTAPPPAATEDSPH